MYGQEKPLEEVIATVEVCNLNDVFACGMWWSKQTVHQQGNPVKARCRKAAGGHPAPAMLPLLLEVLVAWGAWHKHPSRLRLFPVAVEAVH